VVDVRDDREIADVLGIHENAVNNDSNRCQMRVLR
jgi:DNA-binding CsgD family transcriptional regulator